MSLLLRIKVKTLAFQSKELRYEEQIAQQHANYGNGDAYQARELLHNIRTGSLRKEARSANLAYGFLRGNEYYHMEASCNEAPDFERVRELVLNYGAQDKGFLRQQFDMWLREAKGYLRMFPPKSEVQPEAEDRGSIQAYIIQIPLGDEMNCSPQAVGIPNILKGLLPHAIA